MNFYIKVLLYSETVCDDYGSDENSDLPQNSNQDQIDVHIPRCLLQQYKTAIRVRSLSLHFNATDLSTTSNEIVVVHYG